MYKPIQSGRLYEKIAFQIEQQIVAGTLQAGDRLPAERELAISFGVSRTAVREAVKTLCQRGLIEVFAGRGTFVANQTGRALRHSLDLALRVGQVDGDTSLIELREMMEPTIALKAAQRATDDQLMQMRQLVDKMDLVLTEPKLFISADFTFHMALAEASQNILLPTIMNSIVDLLQRQRDRIFKADGGQVRAQKHHRLILAAVTERDGQAAYQAMVAHLVQVREDFEEGPEKISHIE